MLFTFQQGQFGRRFIQGIGGETTSIIVKQSTESVSSNDTLQNDDELLIPIAANEIWEVDFELLMDGDPSGDYRVAVVAPSGASGFFLKQGTKTGDTATDDKNNAFIREDVVTPSGLTGGLVGAGTTQRVFVKGYIINGATPGDVQLQWAQRASNATATRVLANSFLLAHKLA